MNQSLNRLDGCGQILDEKLTLIDFSLTAEEIFFSQVELTLRKKLLFDQSLGPLVFIFKVLQPDFCGGKINLLLEKFRPEPLLVQQVALDVKFA